MWIGCGSVAAGASNLKVNPGLLLLPILLFLQGNISQIFHDVCAHCMWVLGIIIRYFRVSAASTGNGCRPGLNAILHSGLPPIGAF